MLRILGIVLKTVGYAVLTLAALLAAYVFWLSGSSHEPVNVRAASTYASPGGRRARRRSMRRGRSRVHGTSRSARTHRRRAAPPASARRNRRS